ncbi:MAG: ATP-binding protein [Pseudomonadota bacterium]
MRNQVSERQIGPLTPAGQAVSRGRFGVVVVSSRPAIREKVRQLLAASRQLSVQCHFTAEIAAASVLIEQTGAAAIVLELERQEALGDLQPIRAAIETLAPTPVIVISDAPEQTIAQDILALGAQEYLCAADLGREDLGRCVRYAIERQILHNRLVDHLSELERTNMRFQSLITDNADALVIVTNEGRVRFANPAAEKLLQQRADELVGSNLGVPVGASDEMEIDFIARDRRRLTLSARFMRTLWEGERAHIVTLRDITDRKQAEKALEQAKQTAEESSQAKSRFLANMSHELRTPLNSIIGFSEMIGLELFGELGHPGYKAYANNIQSAGSHLLELINDLLDLSKVEAGRLELEETEFDPADICRQVVASLEPKANEADITLAFANNLSDTAIVADERKIKQILLNLLSNAVKFTPAGGQARVTLELARDEVAISVSDNGIGIPEDQIPRAFEAFGQVKDSFVRNASEGSGLGLALSKQLIELHGGSLQIASKVDHGTTVAIRLPSVRTRFVRSRRLLADAAKAVALPPPPPTSTRRRASAKVAR